MERSRSRKSDVYRVERLVARRQNGRRVEYLVKWKNWSDVNNTWEPEKNILDKRLIESFLRNEKKKRNRKHVDSSGKGSTEVTPGVRSSGNTAHTNVDPKRPLTLTVTSPNTTSGPHSHLTNSKTSQSSPSPSSPVLSTHHSPELDGPTAQSTALSAKSPTSPSASALNWDSVNWLPDRRFRPSTLMVAAASASAAHAAAALASSRTSGKQLSSPSSTGSNGTSNTVRQTTTTTDSPTSVEQTEHVLKNPEIEERPKIRITIPRDRILPCPPPGISSSSSSQNSSQLTASSSSITTEDELGHASFCDAEQHSDLFVAPTELPRRAPLSNSPTTVINLRTPELSINSNNPVSAPSSPKWNIRTKEVPTPTAALPRFVLHTPSDSTGYRKRQIDTSPITKNGDHPVYENGHYMLKKRKHCEKKEKRKRHRDHDSFSHSKRSSDTDYDEPSNGYSPSILKLRRSDSTPSTISTDSFLPTSPKSADEAPRLAPLRIQLPRPLTAHSSPNQEKRSSSTSKKLSVSLQPPRGKELRESGFSNAPLDRVKFNNILSPDSKCLRLVQEICVTDVTVGGLTISIKECSGPENFFGIPSNQMVQWDQPHFDVLHSHTSVGYKSPSQVIPAPCLISRNTKVLSPCMQNIPSECVDENVAPISTNDMINGPSITRVCELSTITEESTVNTSLSSTKQAPSPLFSPPFPKLEETSGENKNAGPVDVPSVEIPMLAKSEPNFQNDPGIASPTSTLLLEATEAAVRSAAEAPSSPGILLLPRRSSTPIDHSPASPIRALTPVESTSTTPSSSEITTTLVSTCITPVPTSSISTKVNVPAVESFSSSCTTNAPNTIIPSTVKVTTAQVNQTRRSTIVSHNKLSFSTDNKKPQKTKQFTKFTLSAPQNRSTGHRTTKSTSVTLPNSTARNDPASVYTFPDSSPTHNLSPRSNASTFPAAVLPKPLRRSVQPLGTNVPNRAITLDSLPKSLAAFPSLGANSPIGPIGVSCATSLSSTSSNLSSSCNSPQAIISPDNNLSLYLPQPSLPLFYTDPSSTNSIAALGSFSLVGQPPLATPPTWQSLLPNTLTSLIGPGLIPTDSQMLTSLGSFPLPSATSSDLSAQLQLASLMAVAVGNSAAFTQTSSSEFFPSTNPLLSSVPDDGPMDLSAKR